MRKVSVNEHLTHVFSVLAARPGALLRRAQESEKMSDIDNWVSGAEEIEIDQCHAITVDQDVVRLEVSVDQRGWSAFETRGYSIDHTADDIGQIGPSGCDNVLRFA